MLGVKNCMKNIQEHFFETKRATPQRSLENLNRHLREISGNKFSVNTGTTPSLNLVVLVRQKWKLGTSMIFLNWICSAQMAVLCSKKQSLTYTRLFKSGSEL